MANRRVITWYISLNTDFHIWVFTGPVLNYTGRISRFAALEAALRSPVEEGEQ